MPAGYAATLEVDLAAIRANWLALKACHAGHSIAAVVKANAYGLGVGEVSRALAQAGCSEFFVATLEEGIELRALLPEASIAVFNGLMPGEEKEFIAHRLMPVLNDKAQVARAVSGLQGHKCVLHIDTGMTRLGLTQGEVDKLAKSKALPQVALVMSHLACANDADHPKNAEQLARFREALAYFPGIRTSLANSSGLFLPPEFHFDLGRPGCAIYGIHPTSGANPMRHVATLSAPIIQLRTLDRNEAVGYGATHEAKKGARIAITALGYADGMFRSLSNQGFATIGGHKVSFAGRVSMDLIALDVSGLPQEVLAEGARAEFINAAQTVNDLADSCGTIGYEIFTRIGRRVKRTYLPL